MFWVEFEKIPDRGIEPKPPHVAARHSNHTPTGRTRERGEREGGGEVRTKILWPTQTNLMREGESYISRPKTSRLASSYDT